MGGCMNLMLRRRAMMIEKVGNDEELTAVFLPYGSSIDTGYLPNNNTKVVCDFGVFKHDAASVVFGSEKFSIQINSDNLSVWINGVKKKEISFANKYCLTHHVEVDSTSLIFDGVSYSYGGEGVFSSSTNLLINNAINKSELVIHQLIISENNVEIIHFIPYFHRRCCLFDTINGNYYYSVGSYKLEVSIPYIFSSGAATYINTGVIPSSTISAEYLYFVTVSRALGPHILSGSDTFFPFRRGNDILAKRAGRETTAGDALEHTFRKLHFEAYKTADNVYFNGGFIFSLQAGTSSWGTELCLGSYGGSPGNNNYYLNGGIAFCKIWDNGVLIRDYVPQIVNNVAGMYDNVSGTFHQSSSNNQYSLIYYH